MKNLAFSVFEDLRRRRLLPVAVLLFVAAIVLPVVALKPAAEPATAPAAAANASTQSVDGLPSPQQALGNEKPLVSLAVLTEASDLEEYGSKNPFKPLSEVTKSGAKSAKGSSETATAASGSDSTSSATAETGSGSGSTGGSGSGETDQDTTSTPTDTTPTDTTPTDTTPSKPKTEKLTYALDATLVGPRKTVRYLNVQKTQMLPSANAPLFIFLGIDATGNNAVFLVDSTLTAVAGEGTCKASNADCATVSLEPGQIMVFKDDKDQRYELHIDQIREVTTASAARAQTKKLEAAQGSGARAAVGNRRRFVPPLITDLFTGEKS